MTEQSTALAAIEGRIDKSIATAMSVGSTGISFNNATEVMEYAKMMSVSGSAVPKHLRGQPGACLGILDDAIRFQMSPYALARKSYFVNDNLAYEAQVLAAIVLTRAPLVERPDITFTGDGPNRKCIVTYTLRGGKVKVYESPAFKDITPKNSPLWKSDPDQQHSYYSLRAGARRHFSDVLLGVYDVEEMASIRDVTPPKESGLASRLSGPSNGFSAANVAEGLATAQPASAGQPARAASDISAPNASAGARDNGDVDEARRQGARAALAGDEREAPEDATDPEKAAWLDAFDTEARAADQDGRE